MLESVILKLTQTAIVLYFGIDFYVVVSFHQDRGDRFCSSKLREP